MTQPFTFLFHDYETWGVNPSKDYPCQFAAIRTDSDFNPLGEPLNFLSQMPSDYLPSPQACLVTGITPQKSQKIGLSEAEFTRKIHAAMSQPNTCSVGYNSIRFDDEVSRYLFFRNFYDPYAREWQNGNSRWDIIDLARATYALRPEGINWPKRDNHTPSFKLEELTAANDIAHIGAHDALSDVNATIGLAKLLKSAQPKLFSYGFSLRQKQTVMSQLNLSSPKPLVHVSSKIPASQGCTTYILPIAQHPKQPNAIICADLSNNCDALINLPADEIRQQLYAASSEFEDPSHRPGLKLIHINRSPFIAPVNTLTPERACTLGINREQCLQNFALLCQNSHQWPKLIDVFSQERDVEEVDVEQSLYSGGFFSREEKQWCDSVRLCQPDELFGLQKAIQNPRLRSLLFRYRARNFAYTLNESEVHQWRAHCQERLIDGKNCLSLQAFQHELETLAQVYQQHPKAMQIIKALYQYAQIL